MVLVMNGDDGVGWFAEREERGGKEGTYQSRGFCGQPTSSTYRFLCYSCLLKYRTHLNGYNYNVLYLFAGPVHRDTCMSLDNRVMFNASVS